MLVTALCAAPASAAVLLDERVAFSFADHVDPSGVVAVGDVDGDGHGDAVIDQDEGRRFHLKLSGRSGLIRIRGIVNDPPLPAGDVNGDGIDDLAVPSVQIRRPGVVVAVLLGRKRWSDVNVERRRERDISVRVVAPTPGIGQNDASVVAAGDVNGDGIDDLALTASSFDTLDRSGAPATVWVLFGRRGMRGEHDTRKLGRRGFAIRGGRTDIGLGDTVAPLGDIDGDRRGDLLIGAPFSGPKGVTNDVFENARGRAFVVYGRRGSSPVVLGHRSSAVTRLVTSQRSALGGGAAGPGDMNGDGLADIAIGAPDAGPGRLGAAYVIPGARKRPRTLDVGRLGAGALLRMVGVVPRESLGAVLAAAGDVDGDGRPDLLTASLGINEHDAPEMLTRPDAVHAIHAGQTPSAFAPLAATAGVTTWMLAADEGLGQFAAGTDLDEDGLTEILVPVSQCGRERDGGRIVAIEPRGPLPPRPPGFGTGEPDTLTGGPLADRLLGLDGPDVLDGADGADCLLGGPGDDRVTGGPGDDALEGEDGADVLDGGDGYDTLRGGAGDDTLTLGTSPPNPANANPSGQYGSGGPGNDRVSGGPLPDSLNGGPGNDELATFEGDDSLDGERGDDTLDGGDGDDQLSGGPGRDTIRAGTGDDSLGTEDGEVDVVDCGPGRDRIRADPTDELTACEERTSSADER